MADDIVTRLRWKAPMGCWSDGEEAADEIERLRAENEQLRTAGDALADDSWNNRSADEAVRAWWEVRNESI